MLQIAVCDPNISHRKTFCDILSKLLFDSGDYHLTCFSSVRKLLALEKQTSLFHLVFLEIHFPDGMSGLETAGQLRYLSPDTDIIFLTDAAEYVTEGYRYHAFDFLIKPVSLARLQDVIGRYLNERWKRPADFLNVTVQRCSIQLPLSHIFYLESFRRKIIAHMWEETTEFYEKLDHLEKHLPDHFLRCHKSFLVNMDRIRNFEKHRLELESGRIVDVSRSRLKEAREKYFQYVGAKL